MRNPPSDFRNLNCSECRDGAGLDFDFTMAFQPIVDASSGEIFAHEALVRGLDGEGAGAVFAHVNDSNRYRFDQTCRVKAISLAAELGMTTMLSINFMPNAVYKPELCIRTTLAAAQESGFPIDRIIFEVTEGERVEDHVHLRGIVEHYKKRGFCTAIDDFGAGYAGLGLLADFQTDIVKLDMGLIRGIDTDRTRTAICRGILTVCNDLGIRVIAEGVETREEYAALRALGIELFQGYYFARPAFRALAEVPAERFAL
ncbi:EAL domain-containing protein [Pseudazoarcus pumilus]|uniref:Diguanylate phosphodiesterase n=1 Tax=Pseudazoarcus pumilus TaxID=2067960 RepID=A0A2I6S9L1_9RHOO|nr:EAL domain-containing protein [Pseudazoarcus pumilus]AUN95942.1 diguanylate phosphodiesterase [Pseudazoarcus pumilus]